MKKIISILLCLIIYNLPANAEEDDVALKTYIDGLISSGYNVVSNNQLSSEEKFNQSSLLIKNNLHLEWMAKYTLGRNKRSLSADKIKEFTEVYSKFVVNAYADLSRHYNGEKAVVKRVKKIDDNMFIINMEIEKTDTPSSIKVDYLIHKLDANQNSYKVADIITEGVSILNSQQSEFNSVISTSGIDALIADLQEKIAAKELKEKSK